jgi:hypothetical protein
MKSKPKPYLLTKASRSPIKLFSYHCT